MKIDIVSASAGTGKTYRLSHDLGAALLDGSARPEGVVAITYTTRAAGELESRIRGVVLKAGRADLAARIRDGYLGTIHSVCQRLLREFALEAGLSPYLEPIPDTERKHLFDRALARVVAGKESHLNELARRLEMEDWKGVLRKVVDKARENGMCAADLQRSAAASRETLARVLPPATVTAAEYEKRLRAELPGVVKTLAAIAAADKDNATARKRVACGERLAGDLARFGFPSWKDQAQFAGLIDVKKLQHATSAIVELVNGHLGCESFHRDLFEMQSALFELAAGALEAFSREKAASHVIDFGDMLALAHALLVRPSVQEALRGRLDLVVVDEFQDTSPIQLAVAARLGELSKRSIWVGDRKQAIFAFQGSDPDLMSAAIEFVLQGEPPDILGKSYRSRPALVDLVSELFSGALAPYGFPEQQVRLVAAHGDPDALLKQPALETWRWLPSVKRGGENFSASEPHAIAAGVEALLASPPTVRERVEGGPHRLRPASRRDVAVLARSNKQCRQIATALGSRGIPARVSLEGLAEEPEAILARAALALLADPSDGVAALEVSWLGGQGAADPDAWLSRRMVEITSWRQEREAAEKVGAHWPAQPLPFADDPRVASLRSAAATHLSPAEAFDLALRAAAIPELLRTWPDPEHRLANVEALRAEARAYEHLCQARRTAATVLGLVRHLAELGDDAKQAEPSAADAVHVSTWHGAKGLEWPVVVLSDLDFGKGRSAFDVAVEPAQEFAFEDPLANRWVRHWPWPYGKMSANLALADAAAQSPTAARANEREARERVRLLYVGFTRARDLLVAVAKVDPKNGPAISALGPLDDATGKPRIVFPFEAKPGASAVLVGTKSWPCTIREFSGERCEPVVEARAAVSWYAAGTHIARPPERVNPSNERLPGVARLVEVTRLGPRRELTAGSDQMGAVGDAIHGFIAADPGGDISARRDIAARLLAAHGLQGAIDARTLLEASDALRRWCDKRYPGAVSRKEWPLRARLSNPPERLIVGEVDLFLELPDGFVLVDHKSFPGGERERDRKITEEWAPQLGWYADVLAKALGKPLKAAFVHLPIRGEMVEVAIGARPMSDAIRIPSTNMKAQRG